MQFLLQRKARFGSLRFTRETTKIRSLAERKISQSSRLKRMIVAKRTRIRLRRVKLLACASNSSKNTSTVSFSRSLQQVTRCKRRQPSIARLRSRAKRPLRHSLASLRQHTTEIAIIKSAAHTGQLQQRWIGKSCLRRHFSSEMTHLKNKTMQGEWVRPLLGSTQWATPSNAISSKVKQQGLGPSLQQNKNAIHQETLTCRRRCLAGAVSLRASSSSHSSKLWHSKPIDCSRSWISEQC